MLQVKYVGRTDDCAGLKLLHRVLYASLLPHDHSFHVYGVLVHSVGGRQLFVDDLHALLEVLAYVQEMYQPVERVNWRFFRRFDRRRTWRGGGSGFLLLRHL